MKQESKQQEIILMLETTFVWNRYFESHESDKKNFLSEKEKLVEACWNGLLFKMLPEILEFPNESENLYLWQIKEASYFLELELGQSKEPVDSFFSIDPYNFLDIPYFN
jgi:hypothetical protein